jgi:hypothetical protein
MLGLQALPPSLAAFWRTNQSLAALVMLLLLNLHFSHFIKHTQSFWLAPLRDLCGSGFFHIIFRAPCHRSFTVLKTFRPRPERFLSYKIPASLTDGGKSCNARYHQTIAARSIAPTELRTSDSIAFFTCVMPEIERQCSDKIKCSLVHFNTGNL